MTKLVILAIMGFDFDFDTNRSLTINLTFRWVDPELKDEGLWTERKRICLMIFVKLKGFKYKVVIVFLYFTIHEVLESGAPTVSTA